MAMNIIPGWQNTAGFLKAAVAAGPASKWNSADKSASITLSNADLTATCGAFAAHCVRGTNSKSSGKWYFEVTIVSLNSAGAGVAMLRIGIATSGHSLTALLGEANALSAGMIMGTSGNGTSGATAGYLIANAGNASGDASATIFNGSKIGVAVDIPNHLTWWSHNGIWMNEGGNPVTGVGGINYVTTLPVFPCFQGRSNPDQVTANFGATAFTYAAPSGFLAWG